MASPLQGLLTNIVGLGTGQLVGRTVELSRPEGTIVVRIEHVALVPSDPVPVPVVDPVRWWLDTIDVATSGMARLLGVENVADTSAGRVDLLDSAELTLREVTAGDRRVDRIELRAVGVDATLGPTPVVRSGPITLVATLTTDDVRTWLPPDAAELGRSLRLRDDGRVAVGWTRGRISCEVAGSVERHGESVDVVADRLRIAGRDVTIPARWRRRRSLPTAALVAIGVEVRDVRVAEGHVVVTLAFARWSEPVTYDQVARLQLLLVDHASRVVVDLVRGRSR